MRIAVPDDKMVTGLKWFNGTASASFPKVLVSSGNSFAPPPYAEAIVISEDVYGYDNDWSELVFSEPVASESGTLFILMQYPDSYNPGSQGSILGVGYATVDATNYIFAMGGDGKWVKISMDYRVLMEPVLADLLPGVILKSAVKDETVEIPVNKVGLFAGPNPFNPETNIELYLPTEISGTVKVFDIRGRLVVELYSGQFTAGQNSFVWQGRDDSGRMQASGAYYVIATAGEKSWTKKLMLVK